MSNEGTLPMNDARWESDIYRQISMFRPVVGPDGEDLSARLTEARWPVPRYFASIIALVSQGNVMWWGKIDGCTVVIKRRMTMGTPVVYAVLPPIDPTGDVIREGSVVTALQQAGIPTKLTGDDARGYGFGLADLDKDGRNAEYVYGGLPTGRAGWRFRNVRAEIVREGQAGRIHVAGGWDTGVDSIYGMIRLARRWRPRTGTYRHADRLVETWANLKHPHFATVIWAGGDVVAYSLIEQTAPGWGSIVARVRDYDWHGLKHPSIALHVLDVEAFQPSWLLNFGSGFRTVGLDEQKRRLGPVAHPQIYTLRTRKLTREEFGMTDPR